MYFIDGTAGSWDQHADQALVLCRTHPVRRHDDTQGNTAVVLKENLTNPSDSGVFQ